MATRDTLNPKEAECSNAGHAAPEGQFAGADKARFDASRMTRVGDEFHPHRKHAASPATGEIR